MKKLSNSVFSIKELHSILHSTFEKEKFSFQPKELYEPFNYILSLGGKRLRPLLVLMSCDMFGGKIEDAISPAIGIELFHNFTLMHDDIMDKAPLRRGKPTVHKKFNTNIAILSGDVMFAYAYQYMLKVNEKVLPGIFKTFNDTAIKVCEGQQWDMNYETQQATIEQYLKMIELKTAALLAGSLKIGALVGATESVAPTIEDDIENIYEFGKNIGIAFQLQDDILDTFGDGKKVGKQVGGDIIQGKKTFLYLKAMELADKKSRQELTHLYFDKSIIKKQKVEKVISIFNELKILQYAEKMKMKFLVKANQSLNAIRIPNGRKTEIRKIAGLLLNRES